MDTWFYTLLVDWMLCFKLKMKRPEMSVSQKDL